MKFSPILAAICCGFILFTACKKNNDDNDVNMSAKKQLLVAGKWRISAQTATLNYMGQDTTLDEYALMPDCDKDDFAQFAADGTGTIDESVNKCADDQQIEHATWYLLDNDTKLAIIDSNPDTFGLDISSTEMKLNITKPNSSGVPILRVYTFQNIN
jgi:hypothetical protein